MSKSRHVFAADLLDELGVPGSLANALAIIAQIQAEGGKALFNPLNTTLPAAGAKDYNSVHVKNYMTYEQGVAATAATLRQANMSRLLAALKIGKDAGTYWAVLPTSPWGTKPPGGMSATAFLADVQAHWFARAMLPISGTNISGA